MKYTDKNFFMEDFHVEKLDNFIERAAGKRKLDIVAMIDGDEGFGKTGLSIISCYYLSQKTGREFSLDNIFFDPEEFITFINSTRKQIIIWDEAALGGLASGWASKIQQLLIQTLMTCRSRQHIIFFNCPKFYRLNQYFVGDRAWGLFHVYSRDGLNAGKMTYYKKDTIERMLNLWQTKRLKPYKIYCNKMLRGGFVDAFNTGIIDEDEYEKKKDFYTQKLLTMFKKKQDNKKINVLKYKVAKMKGLETSEKAKEVGVSYETMRRWGLLLEKYPKLLEN